MNNIKICILGADGYVCQIPRIKEGMEILGHVLSKDCPDIIYSNDPRGYQEALDLKKKYPSSYLIFNLLDIPWHMPNIKKQTELEDAAVSAGGGLTSDVLQAKTQLAGAQARQIQFEGVLSAAKHEFEYVFESFPKNINSLLLLQSVFDSLPKSLEEAEKLTMKKRKC